MNIFILSLTFYCLIISLEAAPCPCVQEEIDQVNEYIDIQDIYNSEWDPENGEYFEGDITWFPSPSDDRQALLHVKHRWTNSTLVYTLSEGFSKEQIGYIKKAQEMISSKTCIKFREKTDEDENYVLYNYTDRGCNSAVGMRGDGEQVIRLEDGCFPDINNTLKKPWGKVAHETMHALGLYHEQSRVDRDKYIKIQWDNIEENHKHNFNIHKKGVGSYNIPYDYDSMMHYGRTSFAIDPDKDTITPFKKGAVIGQRNYMSEGNIKMLNTMYCPIGDFDPIEYFD